uniref:Uncharacterized protein n=1 Tax=Caenorhabditis japonica TaxID=281687 RepID=A0A8R1ETU7_CAEJA
VDDVLTANRPHFVCSELVTRLSVKSALGSLVWVHGNLSLLYFVSKSLSGAFLRYEWASIR